MCVPSKPIENVPIGWTRSYVSRQFPVIYSVRYIYEIQRFLVVADYEWIDILLISIIPERFTMFQIS
jgi:hypothetical protein